MLYYAILYSSVHHAKSDSLLRFDDVQLHQKIYISDIAAGLRTVLHEIGSTSNALTSYLAVLIRAGRVISYTM